MAEVPSIHASCVAVGEAGVLIRGPSGAGKSHLAFALILAGRSGVLLPTLLVADDRVLLDVAGARVMARPVPSLAGLIEVRGAGVRRIDHRDAVRLELVVDLAAEDAERMPRADLAADLCGLRLPRLALGPGMDAFPAVVAHLTTMPGPV
ncbi:HPr kinase/phosphatase C-terminal domain-containing protein [Ancylobacter sp. 6x-1]|uniref:HPr kinase/phosphatase C-terminal domain-containing protein n=1 Tax=Ancylobacter crimeensis TaxID=2579147 RepID=A0ABT0D7G6_9HYPH|nr:HPr kinase/phosphatase C-terminal domain-containing protein [Ancylobacter crimeensis]MCK0195895.1 HPr kinase/phosphatase C-terminal domain-containing protein [Ancylobacter crimeensis]